MRIRWIDWLTFDSVDFTISQSSINQTNWLIQSNFRVTMNVILNAFVSKIVDSSIGIQILFSLHHTTVSSIFPWINTVSFSFNFNISNLYSKKKFL
jgi:hypothetical protein